MLNKDFINVTFDKSILKPISLKELCLLSQKSIDFSAINMKIELLDDVKIYLRDDLIDQKDLINFKKIEHKIEFILNRASVLEYNMNLRPTGEFEQLTQNNCEFDKNLKLNIAGQHAFAKVRMNCLGLAQQKLNFFTEQNHLVSLSSSCLRIKIVLLDAAELHCNSKIFVDKGLQEVFARQINKNLLLGLNACVSTTPQLEVLSDHVKCKHGATVKTLDEEQLFYISSRGVAKKQASDLLINGFLH